MKKIVFLLAVALFGLTFIMSCGPSGSGSSGSTSGEDTINVLWAAVLPSVETTYTTYAQNNITIGTTSVFASTFPLTKTAVARLQTVANKLSGGSTSEFVTGVQIQYGIDTNGGANSFDLFIKPLYLVCTTPPPSGTAYTYTATAASLSTSNIFYSISPTGVLTPDKTNQNVIDLANYKREIRISHYVGDLLPVFTPGQDVESVTYPFQEIDTLMKCNSDTLITLLNIGVPLMQGSYPYIRQSVLLEPPGCASGTPINSYFPQNTCADVANPCPPSCCSSGVVFYVYKKP